jgi:hypothetical protein
MMLGEAIVACFEVLIWVDCSLSECYKYKLGMLISTQHSAYDCITRRCKRVCFMILCCCVLLVVVTGRTEHPEGYL